MQPVVIELNLETVRLLGGRGILAIYGDARHRQTLIEAGIETAAALALTSSDSEGIAETIRYARELNPRIRIIARTTYAFETAAIRRDGVDAAFSSEGEVALAMTEFLLGQLGTTAEQVDRYRDRLRADFLGSNPKIEFWPGLSGGEEAGPDLIAGAVPRGPDESGQGHDARHASED